LKLKNGGVIPFSNLHNEHGPAIIKSGGSKEWWVNDKRHREDGPAVISNNNDKFWYKHGKRHRLDGPAIIWNNGYKGRYINGKKLNTNEVETWIKNNNINLKTKLHQVLFMLKFG